VTAADEFAAGEAEVRVLLSFCVESDKDEDVARNNAVRRAGVVLLVSHFESFLRTLAENFVDVLSTGALEARSIPTGVRELHTIPRLYEIVSSNDPKQRHALLRKLGDISALWNDSAKPARGTLSATKLSREVTSAKADKIDNLFSLMGSPVAVCDGDIDLSNDDEEVISLNIRLALADVVQCRNDIAHGDSSRKPTQEDVDKYLLLLAALAQRLQRKSDGLTAAFLP